MSVFDELLSQKPCQNPKFYIVDCQKLNFSQLQNSLLVDISENLLTCK